MKLAGRMALVTGAGSGIGAALCRHAAALGMIPVLVDRDERGLAAVVAELTAAGAKSHHVIADVCDASALDTLAQRLPDLGETALVFVNAGAGRSGAVAAQSAEDTDLMIDVNLKGSLNCLRSFVPMLAAQPTASRVIITGSQASLLAYKGIGVYGATKHGLWAIAETLRDELQDDAPGVSVSLLIPGPVATAMSGKREPRPGEEPAGMPPHMLARIVFDEIAAEKFWIFSHPEVREMIASRMANVLAAFDQ